MQGCTKKEYSIATEVILQPRNGRCFFFLAAAGAKSLQVPWFEHAAKRRDSGPRLSRVLGSPG